MQPKPNNLYLLSTLMRLPLFLLFLAGPAILPITAADDIARPPAAGSVETPATAGVDYAALAANAEKLGDLPNAAMLLERARSDADDRSWRSLTLKLADLKIRLKEYAAAEQLLQEMAARFPIDESVPRRILECRLLFAAGKYAETEALCRELRGLGNLLSLEQLTALLNLQAAAELATDQYQAAAATYAELGKLALPREEEFEVLVRQIYALLLAGELTSSQDLLLRTKQFDRPEEQLVLKKLRLLQLSLARDLTVFLTEYPLVTAELSPDRADYLMMQAAWQAAGALQETDQPESSARAAELLRDAYRFAETREEQKDILFEFANAAMKAGLELEAAAALDSFLAAYPDDESFSRLLMEAGKLYSAAGKYQEALEKFRQITSRISLPVEVRLAAALESVAVARQAGLTEAENRNLAYLIRHARNSEQRQDAYFLTGETQLRREEYLKAAESFAAAAAETGEKRETAVYWQLQSLIKAEKYTEGLQVVERLRKSGSPELRLEAEFFTALLLEKTGKAGEAMTGYLQLVQEYPDSELAPMALFSAGSLAEREGSFVDAARIFVDYAEKFPQNDHAANALFKAAQAAFLVPDEALMQQATEALQSRYRTSPFTFAALFLRTDLQFARSRYAEALGTLDSIAKLAENNPEILARCRFDAANIHLRLDDPTKAQVLLAELLEENIGSSLAADAARLAGDLAYNAGQYAEGAALYRRAASLRPAASDSFFAGACLESAADCDRNLFQTSREPQLLERAINTYSELIASEHTAPAAVYSCLYKLGLCREMENKVDLALAAYGEILHRAIADRQAGRTVPAVWVGKAVYAAVQLRQRDRKPEAGREALKLIELFRSLQLETGEDFDGIMERIRERYRI